jgi:hypothetical protein
MYTRSKKSLVILFSLLLLLLPAAVQAQKMSAKQTAAADSMVSVDFKQCGRPAAPNPASFDANPDDMVKLLNGVWVGTRYQKDGSAQVFNYVMVYDGQAREAFIYEELGDGMKENVFAKQFGAPLANATTITYFYCGSPRLAPFKDVFVKVSDNPRLNPTEKHLGFSVSDKPLGKVWESLKDSDVFTRPRGTTEVNAAFFTMAATPNKTAGRRYQDIRLDLAGQLRGSINKSPEYARGQPAVGLESGVFQGVTSSSGNYLVSTLSYTVQCWGSNSPVFKLEANLPPLANFRYTKVVIGPLGN